MMNQFTEEYENEYLESYDELAHYGMPRRSGRYPWGSGEEKYQHGSRDFLGRVDELRKSGFTYTDPKTGKSYSGDTAIAKSMGLSTTQFRTEIAIAKDERRALNVAKAKSLTDDGWSPTRIGREMGVNESTVRSWLNEQSEARMKKAQETADFLRKQVDEKGMIDVGTGVERELGISKEKLNQAIYILNREGYPDYTGGIPQATNPGQQTNQRVLCKPGTPHKDIYQYDKVHTINDYISRDGGETYEKKFHYPASMDSKRMMIRYADDVGVDGFKGIQKDGIIELRRGVQDLSLGESRYSQVRILVDGTHYAKGMAVYSDNMPDGVDVIFNTNKKAGTPMGDVLKKIKNDPDNPFGSAIKDAMQGGQYWYNDAKTGEKKLGLINKRADEGDWDDWKDALPSQFLAKQSITMAQKQLNLAKADKLAEYDELCSLTNPTVKKHLLQKFADSCDSAAVHLQAAALPGQKYHVILPINSLREDEIYAPGYENGTKLALVRYPHGGTFEIPILKVNNKNALGKEIIGTSAIDGVGINSKVAERLSGADFDGDTVMCIPTHDKGGKVKIINRDPLPGLEGFDSKEYKYDKTTIDADGTEHYYRNGREFKIMKNTGTQMGIVSNLITDMTLAGADDDELARAVRHSMVVIDAEKHKLDYKQSEKDNNIPGLQKKYQPKYDEHGNMIRAGGATTILSKAKGEKSVDKRQGSPKINTKYNSKGELNEWYDPSKPEGSLIWKTADDLNYTVKKTYKNGKTVEIEKTRTQKSTRMAETDDAYTLVSEAKHPMEMVYADYANSMKSLANQARMEMINTPKLKYDANAKNTYQNEVNSLKVKLNDALLNTTRERQAQRLANAEVKSKIDAGQISTKPGDVKKAKQQAITKYRQDVGSIARSVRAIKITDKEWEAIQAGAISDAKLKQILDNTDIDSLRQRATPRTTNTLSTAKVNQIKQMSNSNYTLEQIAKKLGVSTSTVSNYLKKGAN